jgi:hydroxymethylbilane synthase
LPPASIRIGTRGSRLALAQAQWTAARLAETHPDLECRTVVIQTTGDKLLTASLTQIAGKGVFSKEIERALLEEEIDLAVHSLKDLPVAQPPGLRLGAISEREDPRDVLIAPAPVDWRRMGPETTVGTSSPRRRAQLLRANPGMRIVEIRGNVPTRVGRVLDGEVGAVVLAAAGLGRLALEAPWSEALDFADMLTAPGQGALGLQIRDDDDEAAEIVAALNGEASSTACRAERAFLEGLGGGCRAPIAAWGRLENGALLLDGMIASPDGRRFFRDTTEGAPEEPEALGRLLAETLVERGAGDLVEALTNETSALGKQEKRGQEKRGQEKRGQARFQTAESEPVPVFPEEMDIDGPLAGKRIVVTRDEGADGPLSDELRRLGAEPLVLPVIAETGPSDPGPLRRAASEIEGFDWIVFSSRRATRAFAAVLTEVGKDLAALPGRTACVGPRTAEALASLGGAADVTAENPGAKGLLETLRDIEGFAGSRVLYPRAEEALPDLAEGMRAMGCEVVDPPAYRTARVSPTGPVADLLRSGACDAVTFASPSAVEALVEALGRETAVALSQRVIFAAIGPTTAAALRRLGPRVGLEVRDRTFEGLAATLAEHFAAPTTPESRSTNS